MPLRIKPEIRERVIKVEEHYSIPHLAKLLDRSPRTIRRWLHAGSLGPYYVTGRTDILIPASGVQAFLDERRVTPR